MEVVKEKGSRSTTLILILGLTAIFLQAEGPLRVCAENPRYFADDGGEAIYLTGSHTWANLVDISPQDPPQPFDFQTYLTWLQGYHHNFIRLWTWELTAWSTEATGDTRLLNVSPLPWARLGPGPALDGKPRFDLTEFDPAYFARLRSRLEAAAAHGIYVSVMLFEGWAMQFSPGAWDNHPFNRENNVNGVDGDLNGDGKGLEIYTLADPSITDLQKKYVKHVLNAVNDLDNVLFEISNENHPQSTGWQYQMIDFIHDYEKGLPKQHPVGMTFQYQGGTNEALFASPADWISPNPEGGYRDNPPPSDGRKVILNDTDHLWGIGGNRDWVWKSFLRGYNPLFMDPYQGVVLGKPLDRAWEPIRRSLGHTLALAQKVPLTTMQPRGDLASSGYCLADPGSEYLVYIPGGGQVTINLTDADGVLAVEWFNTEIGLYLAGPLIEGNASTTLTSPFEAAAVVLHLQKPG